MESANEPSVTIQSLASNEKPSKVASEASSAKLPNKRSKKKNKKSSKSSKSRSSSPSKSKSAGDKLTKKINSSKSKSSRKGVTSIGLEGAVDIMSSVAMENLSYIAHEAQGALVFRGYPWTDGLKKKKSSKGKKKK